MKTITDEVIVVVKSNRGLRLMLTDRGRGVVVQVLDTDGKETRRFLVDNYENVITLWDFNSSNKLILEVSK